MRCKAFETLIGAICMPLCFFSIICSRLVPLENLCTMKKRFCTACEALYNTVRMTPQIAGRGGLSHRSIGPCPRARHCKGPAWLTNKIIKDVLVIHSNTCSLSWVTQLHIVVCVSHITLYVTASISGVAKLQLAEPLHGLLELSEKL